MVTKVSIFVHYKQDFRTIVEIDFSNYINSIVFFQLGKNRILHLVAFFFKNLNSIKCNYKIYDKELLSMI